MILQNFFDEKLQLPNIKVKRVYRVGNKQNSKKRTIVTKFASLEGTQKVLSETRKLKAPTLISMKTILKKQKSGKKIGKP